MNFFEQMWEQNKEGLANQATTQLSNIGTQLIQNQVNSLFKVGVKQGSVVQTTPQMVQVMQSNNMTYYLIGGGVAVLLVVFLIVKK